MSKMKTAVVIFFVLFNLNLRAVLSQTLRSVPVRLRGGSSCNRGRVEVYYQGEWGTVCDDHWDSDNANVVCRQLGYSRATLYTTGAYLFGPGTGRIWLDEVRCTGSESALASCPRNVLGTHNCVHSEDAGVVCSTTTTGLPTAVIAGIAIGVIIFIGIIVAIPICCCLGCCSQNRTRESRVTTVQPQPTVATVHQTVATMQPAVATMQPAVTTFQPAAVTMQAGLGTVNYDYDYPMVSHPAPVIY